MKSHIAKKCLIDCSVHEYFYIGNVIADQIDSHGCCPPPDVRIMVLRDGDTLEICIGTPQEVYRDTGVNPCI